MPRWREGYCPDCGTFLGDFEYLEEHYCPFMDDDDYEEEGDDYDDYWHDLEQDEPLTESDNAEEED